MVTIFCDMGSEKITQKCQDSSNNTSHETQSKPFKKGMKNHSFTAYAVLALLRVVLTLIPQTGYIHPDEYFQTIEFVAEDVFDLEVQRPWEFNVSFPIRSVLLPKILYGVPYTLLATFTPDLHDLLGWDVRTPYVMLIIPRLVACALSFVTDYCLYKICVLYGQKYRTRLLILASSYVPIIHGTRTFTNSLEMALMSILLLLVADCMIMSDKVIHQEEFLDQKYSSCKTPVGRTKLYKMRGALPSHSLRRCFAIASVVVAGVFNRPTFLAFGLAPVFFWLQRGIISKHCGIRAFHLRILLITVYAVPALLLFILVDSFYYGHLTWNEIGMGDVSLKNFVVTPFNFLLYNSLESNLAQHGLHPRITHMFINIPLLYNVLGFTGIIAMTNFLFRASQARWKELPRAQSLMMLMTTSLLAPIIILSLIPHQEARFLIPITLPIVFLHAQAIQNIDSRPALAFKQQECIQDKKKSSASCPKSSQSPQKGKSLINVWIIINCLLTIFFGFIHQGGIYPLTVHLKEVMKKQTKTQVVHLVTSYMYPLPQALLVQRNSKHKYFDPVTRAEYQISRKFYAYELGSRSLPDVVDFLKNISQEAEVRKAKENVDYALYLALPSSLVEDHSMVHLLNLTLEREQVFYPHLSTEAPPHLFNTPFSFSFSTLGDITNTVPETESFKNHDQPKTSLQSSENSVTNQLLSLLQQFSLSLYTVKVQHKLT